MPKPVLINAGRIEPMNTRAIVQIFSMVFLSAFLFTRVDAGNDRASARSVGLARAHTASVRGSDAVGVNPALLSVYQPSTFEIRLIPFGVRIGSNFLDYNFYADYFTGTEDPVTGDRVAKHLTPQDKQNILDSIPDGNGKIHVDAQVLWLGISIYTKYLGGIAFTVSDRFSTNLTIPDDYLRMLFDGFSATGSLYDFNGTDAQSWWIREYAFSYATPRFKLVSFLPTLAIGGGIKLIEGYSYFGIDTYDGYISNRSFEEGFVLDGKMNMITRRAFADFIHYPGEHRYNLMSKPAGMGMGFDAGIAASISKNITLGFSITDIGSIKWTENTYGSSETTVVEIDDIFSMEQQDSLRKAYTGNDERIAAFTTPLPTALRAGLSWQISHTLMLAADYTRGLNNMPANTTTPRIAFGCEWSLFSNLLLRTGIAFGGHDDFTWAFGFGLLSIEFDLEVATENIEWVADPAKSNQASITISTKFRF